MIHIEYRGLGGSYTNLFKEKIKIVSRVRNVNFSSGNSPINSFKVACTPMSGDPLTLDQMKEILRHKDITFFIGDSAGLSSEIINSSDMIVSVGHYYSMSHQLQAATVIEEIEQCVTQYVEPVVVLVEKPITVEPEPQIQLIENIEDTSQNDIEDENTGIFDDETLPEIRDEDEENKIAPPAIVGSARRIDNKIVEKFIGEIGRNGMPVKEIEEFVKSMEDGTSQAELMQKWIDIGGTVPEQVEKVAKPKQDEPKPDVVKKKRGRPRKEISIQVVSKTVAEKSPVVETNEKKRRGRPVGSKNKSKVPVDNVEPVVNQEVAQEVNETPFISVDTEFNTPSCEDVEQSTGMRKIGYYVPEKLIYDVNSVCDMFSITRAYFCTEALTTYLGKNLKVKPNQEVADKKFFTDEISIELWNQLSEYCADNNLNGYTMVIETAFENYICELND